MSEVNFNFVGKNFIVIGASSGMGRQITLELAQAGAHVLAIARNQERLQEIKSSYPALIDVYIIDVISASDEDWELIISNFVKKYGKIHGEVYTAGIGGMTPLRMHNEELAKNIVETSFWGAIKSLKIATKRKYANKSSSYVLFSSVAGYSGEKGIFAYSAAKAAVQAAVRSICHDLSRDCHRINTISPGHVKTSLTITASSESGEPVNVINRHLLGTGEPSDVSGIVLFLLSGRAKWITGQDFVVDGGYLRGAFF